VPGPIDVVGNSGGGVLDADLRTACLKALKTSREAARLNAEQYTWRNATEQILAALQQLPRSRDAIRTAETSRRFEGQA